MRPEPQPALRLLPIIAAALYLAAAPTDSRAEPTPQATVDELVSGPRGERGAILLQRVQVHPEAHIPILIGHFNLERVRSGDGNAALHKAQHAAQVIVRAGGEDGRVALAAALVEALDAVVREQAALNERAGRLRPGDPAILAQLRDDNVAASRALQLVRTTVASFGAAGDPRLIDAVIARLGQQDVATRLTLYRYLVETAPAGGTVADLLAARWKGPASPIAADPHLDRTIDALRRSAQRAPQGP